MPQESASERTALALPLASCQMNRAPIDRAPYVSLTGALLLVKIEAYTLLLAPTGA